MSGYFTPDCHGISNPSLSRNTLGDTQLDDQLHMIGKWVLCQPWQNFLNFLTNHTISISKDWTDAPAVPRVIHKPSNWFSCRGNIHTGPPAYMRVQTDTQIHTPVKKLLMVFVFKVLEFNKNPNWQWQVAIKICWWPLSPLFFFVIFWNVYGKSRKHLSHSSRL